MTISNAFSIFKSFNHHTQPLPSNTPFPPNLSCTLGLYHLAIIPCKIIAPFAKFITPRLRCARRSHNINKKPRFSGASYAIKNSGVSCSRRLQLLSLFCAGSYGFLRSHHTYVLQLFSMGACVRLHK
jgi:hypothetical protein